jgi:aminodeoxyfutalosine deaminase
MAYFLRARVVFPVDRPPIEHGVVTIEGERIVAVGATPHAGDATDLGDIALLPGLVNAHTHLEFSHLRRPLGEPGMRLVDWIRLVIAERGRGDCDLSESIAAGLAESVRYGVTALGDIATIGAGHPVRCSRPDGEDCASYGGPELTLLLETIGFSRARAESAFAAVTARLAELEIDLHLRIGLSPHAPYTVSPDFLRRLVMLAQQRTMPVAMHLAESLEELELLENGSGPFKDLLEERSMWDAEAIPRGSRPLDYLRLLAGAPRALVIHGNYLDDEERSFLAARAAHMSLVYCPRTHAYFGHPPYPLGELLASGVRVALGTDSRASNPDLNLLAEMRLAAGSHGDVDPHDVLRMGTLGGAEALGRAADVGSISPGKLANLVAVALPAEARDTADESLAAILAGEQRFTRLWLRGVEVTPSCFEKSCR